MEAGTSARVCDDSSTDHAGATPRCYTAIVPTQHPRIAVTNDPELASALERVEHYFPDAPTARIVHELALRGAEVIEREQTERGDAIERLIALFTEPNDRIDLDVLEHIDELAWRR